MCMLILEIMEQFSNHELEYVVDDFADFDDFTDSPRSSDVEDGEDSDFEDDSELVIFFISFFFLNKILEAWIRYEAYSCHPCVCWALQSKSKDDTSALEARNGKDIQGIPWERMNFTRDKYRETRLKQYKNYESLSCSHEELEKVWCFHVLIPSLIYFKKIKIRLGGLWSLLYSSYNQAEMIRFCSFYASIQGPTIEPYFCLFFFSPFFEGKKGFFLIH